MTVQTSTFQSCRLQRWHGRYARIPGDTSVFHLKALNGRLWPAIVWETEDGTATCYATDSASVASLAVAVESAKRRSGGTGGGSFVINEFGQVLVPSSDGDGTRYIVGQLNGAILFQNPFDEDDPIDLSDISRLRPGDPWKIPYVGFPFNLSKASKIYFYEMDADGGRSIFPEHQDMALIQSIRQLRRSGAVRFIVNHAGVVLTKCPPSNGWSPEESWQPFFVGRINRDKWFAVEDGNA
jgi:hypothetical protein